MSIRDKEMRETDQVVHRKCQGYDDFLRGKCKDVDDGDLEL